MRAVAAIVGVARQAAAAQRKRPASNFMMDFEFEDSFSQKYFLYKVLAFASPASKAEFRKLISRQDKRKKKKTSKKDKKKDKKKSKKDKKKKKKQEESSEKDSEDGDEKTGESKKKKVADGEKKPRRNKKNKTKKEKKKMTPSEEALKETKDKEKKIMQEAKKANKRTCATTAIAYICFIMLVPGHKPGHWKNEFLEDL